MTHLVFEWQFIVAHCSDLTFNASQQNDDVCLIAHHLAALAGRVAGLGCHLETIALAVLMVAL